jgi:hypothetical protein
LVLKLGALLLAVFFIPAMYVYIWFSDLNVLGLRWILGSPLFWLLLLADWSVVVWVTGWIGCRFDCVQLLMESVEGVFKLDLSSILAVWSLYFLFEFWVVLYYWLIVGFLLAMWFGWVVGMVFSVGRVCVLWVLVVPAMYIG